MIYEKIKLICCLLLFSIVFCCSMLVSANDLKQSAQQKTATQKVIIELFFRQGCKECAKVKAVVLPKVARELSGKYELRQYDLGEGDNYIKLVAYQEHFKNNRNAAVYMVINGRQILGGFEDINNRLTAVIETEIASPHAATLSINKGDRTKLLKQRVNRFTLLTVLIAGLIDGINPCVFATLIFFISLLSVARVTGSRLLLVGGTYCFACFLTYLLLGFGIFNFLKFFSGYSYFRDILEWFTFGILILFAVISFMDAIRYKLSKKADAITLQLPDSLKKRIHAVMKRGLNYHFLLPGIFSVGVLVTIIESVCTGQVYIPTLVLLTKECGAGVWLFYLLLYNLAFIIPLLIVFAIAWHGTNTLTFVNWSKRHLVYSKIVLGLFFIFMAVIMLLLR